MNFEGDNDLDSFSWNHVLISSFQAPTSIHDRDIIDDFIMSCSIGSRYSHTHVDDHGEDYSDHHHHNDAVHISPINNEDLHSYINTTNTCDGILTMMSYELMQKKRLSRLWSIVCPHINAY